MEDTVVVLSHEFDDKGDIDEETKQRAEIGVQIYLKGFAGKLILSGGFKDKKYNYSHASMMKKYAVSRGVKEKDIILEEKSIDTVGQAVFTKIISDKNNLKTLTIISSNYHLPRVIEIFSFVFGNISKIEYKGVNFPASPNTENKEKASFEAFKKTFEGISPGDIKNIQKRLFESHPLYIGRN